MRLLSVFFLCSLQYKVYGHISDTHSSKTVTNANASISFTLETINGTGNFRITGKKGKEDKTWFDGREMKQIYCVRPAKCEELTNSTCLGSNLPYSSTSLILADSDSQRETIEKLNAFQALRHIPKCWAVIQPFLCSLYMPKCEKIGLQEMVYLPSQNMCKIAMDACRFLNNTTYFPKFFRCDEKLYPPNCNNDVREVKFNITGQCLRPLVQAESSSSYFKDIEGCGLQCQNPLYTDDEHRQIHKLIAWGACICLGFNLFTIFTFLIDWKSANKYPALIIFYINFCFMMSCLGWLAQFTPGGREDIICRRDGTLRHSEPSAGENLSCIVVFVLVYYFLIAAMVWFVIFTYAWHMSFKAIGKIQDRIDKKGSYFHLIAWSLPLVLTITIMALSEVDGSSVVGICFVGYLNHAMRIGLLLGPVISVLITGGYFLGRGMLTLIRLKITSKEIISTRASKKIRETIVRMGICTILILVFILTTIVCHINEFKNSDDWAESLRMHMVCKISTSYSDSIDKCKLHSRPSVAILQLHLLCFFASGIIMSSWVWTHSTVETWGRYIRKKIGHEQEEPVKLQKHKLIAQAFAKRREFQDQGKISLDFSHTDPVGLNFDLNSIASQYSSTWEKNLGKFINRRYALTGATTSSSHGPRRSSMDSEISFSVRHVSVESRRNSVDSQVSVKIAEMKTKVEVASRREGKGNHWYNRRRNFSSGRKYSRRESSTSIESQIITALQKSKYSGKCGSTIYNPGNKSIKRRSANAGLDPNQVNALLSNGKLIFPFLKNQDMTTSDDETGSLASFKVKDSQLNIILKQVANCDVSDLDDSQLKRNGGCDVTEYNTTDDEKMNMKNSKKTNYQTIQDILDERIRGSSDESTLRNSKEGGRNSKNSTKSTRSRKSTRQGSGRIQKSARTLTKSYKVAAKKEKEISDFDDSSFTSYCSELSPLGGLQSSYSGISVAKTNSRNSKRSCDVGIQTNAHEIATQTNDENGNKSNADDEDDFDELDDERMPLRSEKMNKNDENTNIYTESLQLLPHTNTKRQIYAIKIRDDKSNISESEKLKKLLLPSK